MPRSLACAARSISGPISVDSRPGSPTDNSAMAPTSMASIAIGHLVLQEQDAQRRTALAGAVEGRRDDILHDLLGQRRKIDDHRVQAAGLGDQRNDRPLRLARLRWMALATSVDPVNATPATPGSATNWAPIRPSPGTRFSTAPGSPAPCNPLTAR